MRHRAPKFTEAIEVYVTVGFSRQKASTSSTIRIFLRIQSSTTFEGLLSSSKGIRPLRAQLCSYLDALSCINLGVLRLTLVLMDPQRNLRMLTRALVLIWKSFRESMSAQIRRLERISSFRHLGIMQKTMSIQGVPTTKRIYWSAGPSSTFGLYSGSARSKSNIFMTAC
jgi:hypothetical protein